MVVSLLGRSWMRARQVVVGKVLGTSWADNSHAATCNVESCQASICVQTGEVSGEP